jgi:hypothetical protein
LARPRPPPSSSRPPAMAACPPRPARLLRPRPPCSRSPGVPPALGAWPPARSPRLGARPWRPRCPRPAPASRPLPWCPGLGRPAMAQPRPPFPDVRPPQPLPARRARRARAWRPCPAWQTPLPRPRRGLGGALAPARGSPPASPPRRGAPGELAAPAARVRGARPGVPGSPAPAPVRCVARGHGARRPGARPHSLSAACPPRPVPAAACPPRAARRPYARPRPRPDPGVSPRPCAARPWPDAASARAAMVPLRSATRAQLGPGVCVTRSRRVSVALRVRARVEREVLWHGSPCPRRARLPPRRARLPPPPPCNPCVVIALFLLINGNPIWKLVTLIISCS